MKLVIPPRPLLLGAVLVLTAFVLTAFVLTVPSPASASTLVVANKAEAGDMVIYKTESLDEDGLVKFDLKAAGFEGRLFGDRFGDSSVPIGVVVDESGSRAWVAHANADVITEVDLEKGEISRLLKAGKEPDGMAYSTRAVAKP